VTNSQSETLFGSPKHKPDMTKFGPEFEKNFNRPLSHRDDPLSSYQAGDRVLRSGKVKGQMKFCLLAVRRWPGRTSAELAQLAGMDRYSVARRLPALEHRGFVKKGGERLCTVCKSKCVTWTPERENYPLM